MRSIRKKVQKVVSKTGVQINRIRNAGRVYQAPEGGEPTGGGKQIMRAKGIQEMLQKSIPKTVVHFRYHAPIFKTLKSVFGILISYLPCFFLTTKLIAQIVLRARLIIGIRS